MLRKGVFHRPSIRSLIMCGTMMRRVHHFLQNSHHHGAIAGVNAHPINNCYSRLPPPSAQNSRIVPPSVSRCGIRHRRRATIADPSCVLTGFSHRRIPLFRSFSHFLAPTEGDFLAVSAQNGESLLPGPRGLTNSETGIFPLPLLPTVNVDGRNVWPPR